MFILLFMVDSVHPVLNDIGLTVEGLVGITTLYRNLNNTKGDAKENLRRRRRRKIGNCLKHRKMNTTRNYVPQELSFSIEKLKIN